MARILVTGYGGFLGRNLCGQLIERGHQVRGLARRAYPDVQALGVEAMVGDATRITDCRQATIGMDGVIHTAALAGVWGRRIDFESINIEATDFLLEAAIENKVKALVHCSSPSVTFDGRPQSGIDESAPYPTQWLCDYPRTKAIAEQKVLARNEVNGLLTCALRPHLIWGNGDPHLIPRLIQRCRSGSLRRIGDGKNFIDTTHVEEAARAHCLAIDVLLNGNRDAAGKAYFITDGNPIGCWDWISQILRGAGLEPSKKNISLKMAYRIGHLFELAYSALRIQREPPMTRFVAAQLGVDHYFSIRAAREFLGFEPQTDRNAELKAMSPWLKTLVE